MLRFIQSRPITFLLLGLLIGTSALLVWAAARPDFEVTWEREVPSVHTPEELGVALETLADWPVFHHGLRAATLRRQGGGDLPPELSLLARGLELRYAIEPPQKEWKRFEILTRIREHRPGRKLVVDFISDSTGKTAKALDAISWGLEIQEAPPELQAQGFASVIRGSASGTTKTGRARLFGFLLPKVLMNQVYPVDLVKLGTLERQRESRKHNLAPSYQ